MLVSAEPTGAGVRLAFRADGWTHVPSAGDSISVSGVCLTLAADPAATGSLLLFDAVPETLRVTTLGRLNPGSRVNLEHSATPQTLMGGHIVQGHVEGLAKVEAVERGAEHRLRLGPPAQLMESITPRGAVALDGVSLTVASVDPRAGTFEVALIPTTLERTTLGRLRPGDAVNIETDVVVRAAVHWLRHYGSGGR